MVKSSRDAGYTTSGRNSTGKSSAKKVEKKAAPKVAKKSKSAPVAKKASKSRFADTMQVPGSARPSVSRAKEAKAPLSKTGRDRFDPSKAKSAAFVGSRGNVPGRNRQEDEARIMGRMRRDRLGPGQR